MINFQGVNTSHMDPLRKAPAQTTGASPISQAMSYLAAALPQGSAQKPVPAPNPTPVMPQPAPNPVPVMPQPNVPAPNPLPVMPQPSGLDRPVGGNVPAPNPVPVLPQPNTPAPNPVPVLPQPAEGPEEAQAQAWALQYGKRRLTPQEIANLRMLYQFAGGGAAGMAAVEANIRAGAQPNIPEPNPAPPLAQTGPNIPEPTPTPLPRAVPAESPEEQQAHQWAMQYGGRRLQPFEVANLKNLYQQMGGGQAGMTAVHDNIRDYAARGGK